MVDCSDYIAPYLLPLQPQQDISHNILDTKYVVKTSFPRNML
jgi:hypothetical protein